MPAFAHAQGNRAGSNEGAVRRAVEEGIHNSLLDWFLKSQEGHQKGPRYNYFTVPAANKMDLYVVLYGNGKSKKRLCKLTNKEKRGKRGIRKSDYVRLYD